MRAFVLQDWVTIRGASTVASVVQNESNYLMLDSFQDAVFWVQVSEFTPPGTGTLYLNLETAPLKDETLFRTMLNTNIAVTAIAMTPPTVVPVIMAQSTTTVPLSRYVRWHATTTSPTAAWDMTFRVIVAANQLFTFNPRWSNNGGGM